MSKKITRKKCNLFTLIDVRVQKKEKIRKLRLIVRKGQSDNRNIEKITFNNYQFKASGTQI